jgi:dihydrofolate reductase
MRKIIYSMPISVDGFVEGPNGLDWVFADKALHELSTEAMRTTGTVLFGRGTYELFFPFWPEAAADPTNPPFMIDYANQLIRPDLEKIVYSKTLKEVGWGARLERELRAEDILAMKARPGRDIAVAGPRLGSALARMGLVDVYELIIHPVVLGSGKRMFQDVQQRVDLKLTETRQFESGLVVLTYESVGS